MLYPENITSENIRNEAISWLRREVPQDNKIEIIKLLAEALSLAKPGTPLQRDLVEKIIEITPDAGKIDPATTIEALSKSFLWVGNEYIPHFAQKILMLEKPAIETNPNATLSALEKVLTVCHCVFIPLELHGNGRENETCLEWQRQTFFSIIDAIETKAYVVDPIVSADILKISEIITYMNGRFADINERIKFISHEHNLESSSWH